MGPILNRVGARRTEDWLRRWLADPQHVKPNTKMPKRLGEVIIADELEDLYAYLESMAPKKSQWKIR